MAITIHHVPEIRRFVTSVDGHEGYVEYSRHGDVLSIDHTIVPPAIGGRGIAGDLVKAAVEYAGAEGLKVHPACSYAEAWMRRHPDAASWA
ncbi:GNAT family N-acetyltransferase [Solilutibacter silvestris]|uniref:Putative acetyltransferase n=1 Tax=Solilutibacter silvestris TaxID=1645665 RepID=A0A2K1PY96_9GAMM|nr:GNAT family N-acetyltransferase [Lysobacter silvestris]PNS07766.1 putative acetyltransferase [Lysobacter silvestris]